MNLSDLARNFSNEDDARDFLEKFRWPDGPICPHCGLVGEAFKVSKKMSGPDNTVEVDETYVGGKQKGVQGLPNVYRSNKTPVVALVERKGRVRSFPVERVTISNLKPILTQYVSPEVHLITD